MRTGTRRVRILSGVGVTMAALTLAAAGCARTGAASSSDDAALVPISANGEVSPDTSPSASSVAGKVSARASASPSSGEKASTSDDRASRSDQAKAFTACVRENGLADFAGVTVTDDGQIQLNASGSGVNVFSSEYKKAVAACQHLLPSGTTVPTDPEPAAPKAPDLGFECSGTCPKAPEAPEPPR
jgi:hypothetical protein